MRSGGSAVTDAVASAPGARASSPACSLSLSTTLTAATARALLTFHYRYARRDRRKGKRALLVVPLLVCEWAPDSPLSPRSDRCARGLPSTQHGTAVATPTAAPSAPSPVG